MLKLGGHNGRVKGGYNGNGGYNGPKAGDTMVRGDTMVGGDTMVHNTRVVSHWLTQILIDNCHRRSDGPRISKVEVCCHKHNLFFLMEHIKIID